MSDDVVDIKVELDDKCLAEKCQHHVEEYRKCLERIKPVPAEKEAHCYGWYFNIVHCVDHCAAKDLWAALK